MDGRATGAAFALPCVSVFKDSSIAHTAGPRKLDSLIGGIQIIYGRLDSGVTYNTTIKITGIFLLISGWLIVLTAVALLPQGGPLSAFLGAGMVVESLGLVLLFRAHRMAPGDRRQ